MTEEQYLIIQTQLTSLAALLIDINIDNFLKVINKTEAVAPLLHTTLYIEAATSLSQIKGIAEAAQVFQNKIKKIEMDSRSSLE